MSIPPTVIRLVLEIEIEIEVVVVLDMVKTGPVFSLFSLSLD
jgi:hypothetical protein